MRVVGGSTCGASYDTLRQAYTTLIRPKLDYGSFLFETAANSTLKELDRVQNAAIRIALGALAPTAKSWSQQQI